jgi:hypothetical protein
MTGDELSALVRDVGPYDTPFAGRVRRAVAEIHRLRELVKDAEARGQWGHCSTCHNCPWCGYDATLDTKRKHAPECPAFTESGDVR